jgi:hypothetical protein
MNAAARRMGVVLAGVGAWLLVGMAGAALAVAPVPAAGGSDGVVGRATEVVLSMWQAGVLAVLVVGLVAALALTTARARRAEHQLAA